MSTDQAPLTRVRSRAYPGAVDEANKPGFGRKVWFGVTKFVSVMGGVASPFAEGWRLAGGPGGDGAIVLTNFMRRLGAPGIRHIGRKVRFQRAQAVPESQVQEISSMQNQMITTEVTNSIGQYYSAKHIAISDSISSGF